MKVFDVIILTEAKYIHPSQHDAYVNNVLLEDELVQNALEKRKLRVNRVAWDDPSFDWSSTKYILVRAIWDYFDRFKTFSKWLEQTAKKTAFINSEDIIRWNIDKHYLLDLKQRGIHIAETHYIEKNKSTTLTELHNQLGWKHTVLKPCVSGAARHTYKLNCENIADHEALFLELIANESMMLQPFQYNIIERGEISMMVFNGIYTHAVLKIAKPGDFRVQDDFGGSVHEYSPTQKEIDFAVSCVQACPDFPLYARVDIFIDNDGHIALSELELIEPELWFRNHHNSADILADAIKEKLIS